MSDVKIDPVSEVLETVKLRVRRTYTVTEELVTEIHVTKAQAKRVHDGDKSVDTWIRYSVMPTLTGWQQVGDRHVTDVNYKVRD